MANINIFEIQETKLCTDLSGRFVMLYGQPKSGKTSTASLWPKPLLCAFEIGYNALVGVKAANIDSWATFKSICRQLEKPEAKEFYQTVIIDTVAIAYGLCQKFICSRESVSAVGDIPYAKGWDMLKDEFATTLRRLTQLGYAVVFIAHSKTRQTENTDEDGNAIEALAPDLPSAAYKIVNELVDIIAYIGVEYDRNGNSRRFLYTRGTPNIFAGSRYKYLTPRIELSYQNLVDAVADAMRKESEEKNSALISEEDMPKLNTGRPFDEAMTELKSQWNRVVTAYGEEGKQKIKDIAKSVFGRDVTLSRATPEQQELIEDVIEQLKSL